jgi:hypothetical protein
MSLGGMVHRRLDDECGMMGVRRVVTTSGIMVASTEDLTRSMTFFLLKMGQRKMVAANF